MPGTMFSGGWRSGARWTALLAFGGVLAFAIWNDVAGGGFNAVQAIEARKLRNIYEDATLNAQSAVRKAHGDSLASCGEETDACRAAAHEAARKAALAALTGGGCIAWEMSQWNPTRDSVEPARPKSRAEAETACAVAAEDMAERMSTWARKQN